MPNCPFHTPRDAKGKFSPALWAEERFEGNQGTGSFGPRKTAWSWEREPSVCQEAWEMARKQPQPRESLLLAGPQWKETLGALTGDSKALSPRVLFNNSNKVLNNVQFSRTIQISKMALFFSNIKIPKGNKNKLTIKLLKNLFPCKISNFIIFLKK